MASLLVHLSALDLLPTWVLHPTDDETNDEPLKIRLTSPARAIEPTPSVVRPDASLPPGPPVAKPQAPPRPPVRPPAPRRTTPPVPSSDLMPANEEPVPNVDLVPPDITIEPAMPTPAAGTTAAPQPAMDAPPAPTKPPVAAPPAAVAPQSARLYYKVSYIDAKNAEPVRYYGVGSIDWSTDDGHYRSDLVASVDFLLFKVDVLSSHSEGRIVAGGLAPDRYTETPRRRATVATSFNRDARQSITFSASPATTPLLPGTQDRLSVLFQIGALLLANDRQAVGGGRLEIPVAGVRGDVETWQFESLGDEPIVVGRGDSLSAIHLRRAARPASNDRTIDVWIARQAGGYPARVLYTEPNGSTIEMTLDQIGVAH